jgi:hypothetical protein
MPLTAPPASPPGRGGGSPLRWLVGIVLFLAALVIAAFGFQQLITVLESGGYGTTPMIQALVVLGTAGACLACAIALLIWEVAKRYER